MYAIVFKNIETGESAGVSFNIIQSRFSSIMDFRVCQKGNVQSLRTTLRVERDSWFCFDPLWTNGEGGGAGGITYTVI